MGIALPQLAPASEDRASGAQVIDGSLKFNETLGSYLTRTPSSNGNRRTWTWSCWCKIAKLPESGTNGDRTLFSAVDAQTNGDDDAIRFIRTGITGANSLYWSSSEYNVGDEEVIYTNAVLRDPNTFYHVVLIKDTTQSSLANGQMRMYINGVEQSLVESNAISQDAERAINSQVPHAIGDHYDQDRPWDGMMSQVYFIDGQALGPESFGYTDGLTNTWRPKKFSAFNNPNNGTTWTNSISGTADSGWAKSQAFDGTNASSRASNGNSLTFTPSSPIPIKTSLRINARKYGSGSSVLTVNGTNYASLLSATKAYVTIPESTITSIVWSNVNGNSDSVDITTIEVDGYPLLDGVGDNSFYLPFDGSAPIGEDQSGNGNNWTPVNFGGSVALDNPQVSGAKPILNVTQGGTQAGVGVFGSKENIGYAVTVAPKTGGGNAYYIDGVERQTLTGLIRGATYTFNQSDSSNDNHPLRLSITDDGTHTGGGAQYTNGNVQGGTPGTAGAATTITIPYNAPNTLYYYCGNHSGMGNNITGITTNEKLADQYASHCTLALPLVGSANDVSDSVNIGSTTKAVTSNNAVASSAQSNFYGGSWYFDGNSDSLTFTTSSALSLSGDFTIEFWIYNNTIVIDSQHPSPITMPGTTVSQIYTNSSSDFYGLYRSGDIVTTGNNSALTGVWQHVAFTRSGSTCYAFLNGVLKNTATNSDTFGDATGTYRIGSYSGTGGDINAYMQDLRVYKGVAKYTSDFVVPATSPDILPDTPSGVSGSSKLAKVTDGAVHFNGSGDYLSIADSSDLTVGTNPFTLEFYAYKTAAGEDFICGSYDSSGTTSSLSYSIQTGGSTPSNSLVANVAEGGSATSVNSGVDFVLNKWVHVAFVRDGNTLRLFQDGIQMSTAAFSGTINDASNAFEIGRAGFSGKDFPGYISNFRFVNGTALYTSNFTPPTRELTNVTNTKLLCCQSNIEPGRAAVSPLVSGINNGTQWSKYLTGGGGFQGSYPASNAFNGVITGANTSRSTNTQTTQTFTPPGGISYSSSVEVWTWYTGNVSLNGGSNVAVTDDQDWRTIASGSGTIDNIRFITDSGNSMYLAGIRIDGSTILIEPITPNGDVAATNFNPFTTDINTVRGQETGYATMNPLTKGSRVTLSDGNLKQSHTASAGNAPTMNCMATIPFGDGKYYFEVYNIDNMGHGICDVQTNANPTKRIFVYSGSITNTQNGTTSGSVPSFSLSDVLSVAYDSVNRNIYFYKNNVQYYSLTGFDDPGVDLHPGLGVNSSSSSGSIEINFGQKPFKFPPPDGYQPLNAANTKPETIFARPDQFVGVTTYRGTGNPLIVPGLNMKPDFIWIKNRGASQKHTLVDSVRTTATGEYLASDSDQSQGTGVHISGVENGISIADPNSSTIWYNDSSYDYVAWCWKAGGNKNTFNVDDVGYASAAAAGITGLDGTGEMTTAKFLGCSIGTKQGFSIIKYKGLGGGDVKVPHGLSQTPDMVIVKNLDSTVDWAITHSGLAGNRSLRFTNVSTDTSGFLGLNKGGLASTYFTINYSDTNLKYVNASNEDYIAYVWHDVPGLQKFGTYEGSGDADTGPFVELGFKPALLIVKNIDDAEHWYVYDPKRSPHNVAYQSLRASSNGGEETGDTNTRLDLLSNGFKLRQGNGPNNSNTYIYAAWAEAPTVNLFGGQSNAR